MVSCSTLLAPLLLSGDFHTARFVALQYCSTHPLATIDTNAADECARAWGENVEMLLNADDSNALDKIYSIHAKHYRNANEKRRSLELVPLPSLPISPNTIAQDLTCWERCCKRIHFEHDELTLSLSPQVCAPDRITPDSIGCALGVGSGGALALPLVSEISVRIRLPRTGRVLDVEQDGFLQPYDSATILWPGGYFLSLWVNDFFSALGADNSLPLWCSQERCLWHPDENIVCVDKRPLSILELGTGVGAASISAAASAEAFGRDVRILATDRSKKSLALTTANAAMNGLNVNVSLLDFTDPERISEIVCEFGTFDLLLGASLEFENWEDSLSDVLGLLTHDDGIVALAHVTGGIEKPPADSSFCEIGRISGLRYGMQTMWVEGESCFEIVLLKKTKDCPTATA